jgi:hypothetical protein
MDRFIKVILLVFLLGFLCALVAVGAALFLVRPEIPPLRKGSVLLVLADGLDFLLHLPQRVSRLLVRLIRFMRGKVSLLVHWL